MGVIGVEDQNDFFAFGRSVNLSRDGRVDAGTFDHLDAPGHRMAFDRLAVVRANVEVDAQYFTVALQLQQRGVVDDRTTVGDAALDDQVRFDLPDDLLHRHHVLWQLDDRTAHPREVVAVLVPGRFVEEISGQASEFLVVALLGNLFPALGFEGLVDAVVGHFNNLKGHWNEALSTA
ncbi:hypothetical protein D3C78_757000 [compost metagenome]